MLEELRRYENLGTPAYFWELFERLESGDSWTVEELAEHFTNRIIDGRSIFDGCIPLLKIAKIIDISDSRIVEINYSFSHILHSERFFQRKLLESFLQALKKDQGIYAIFSPEYSSYDFIYKSINIKFSAFGFRYANIRRLLIDFDFFKPHPDFPDKILIVNPYWKKFFEAEFAPEIRRRKIGIEELRKQQEKQQIDGEMAEKFVLKFEQFRLNEKKEIQWISPYDSGAGYDILSFHRENSEINDRYIEVKSYSGISPYFYWTRNEIATAEKHPERYFIYLVNRDELDNSNYEPKIIPDPIRNILHNEDWEKEVDKYYITEK